MNDKYYRYNNDDNYDNYDEDDYYSDKYNDYYNDYDDNYNSYKYNRKSRYDDWQYEEDINEDNDELLNNDKDINIDEDLAGYFSDARLFSMKDEEPIRKKPKKIIYKADDKVIISMNKTTNKGQVLFGPYEVNKKQMYQIELENGQLIEADDKHMQYDNLEESI